MSVDNKGNLQVMDIERHILTCSNYSVEIK